MKAAFQRTLRPGTEYDKYFPTGQLQRADPVVMEDSDTFDTIDLMAKLARPYQADTSGVARVLTGKTRRQTLENNWNFAYNHFQYTEDKAGVEQLRRPLRAWADRVAGIDCDCYAILLSTILLNQGIAHSFRKTKYNGKADYQHIYVIVPTAGGGHVTLDPVTDKFDKEVPFSAHFDKPMSIQVLNGIPLQVLNGAPEAGRLLVEAGAFGAFGFGAELIGLESEVNQVSLETLATIKSTSLRGFGALGDLLPDPEQLAEHAYNTGQTTEEAAADAVAVAHAAASFTERMRQHLANTVEQIDRMPQKAPELALQSSRIKQILSVWDNEAERTRLFVELGAQEQAEARADVAGSSGVAPDLSGLGGAPNLSGWFDWVGDAASAVGGAISSAAGAVGQAASWVGNGIASGVSSAAGGVAQAASWTYGTIIQPVGQAIAQAATWVANTVAAGISAAAQGIKKAAIWVAKEAVALGKLLLKYNPLSILIRAGLRVAFRVNLFYMSGRLGHGYFSEQQAQAFGMDLNEWRKCKSTLGKVISMWEGLQGDSDILKESILLGYQSGEQPKIAATPLNGLSGLGALGDPATGTATVASSGFIATIVAWLKNVDWEKLFKGVKAAAGVVQSTLAKFKSVPPVTENTLLPTSEADYQANQARYETQKTPATDSGSSLALPLLGAAAVGFLILNNFK
jgi:hypothetical protein